MDTATLQRLAAHAAPSAIPDASSNGTREHRFWIVRLGDKLSEARVGELTSEVQGATAAAVRAARAARGLPGEAEHGQVQTEIHRAGPMHVLLRVTTVVHRLDEGDTSLLAQGAALQALDAASGIEDIQGFPKSCWSILLAGENQQHDLTPRPAR